jgi:hypothetical protein
MGTDCTIYVLFIRHAAAMFFVLCITQTCLLIPLYYSGDGYKTFTVQETSNSTAVCTNTTDTGVDECLKNQTIPYI